MKIVADASQRITNRAGRQRRRDMNRLYHRLLRIQDSLADAVSVAEDAAERDDSETFARITARLALTAGAGHGCAEDLLRSRRCAS